MNREPVNSSNLKSIGYDCERLLLEIEFHGGSIYEYQGVPEHIYSQLMEAPSMGSFFHKFIKDRYPCSRIR